MDSTFHMLIRAFIQEHYKTNAPIIEKNEPYDNSRSFTTENGAEIDFRERNGYFTLSVKTKENENTTSLLFDAAKRHMIEQKIHGFLRVNSFVNQKYRGCLMESIDKKHLFHTKYELEEFIKSIKKKTNLYNSMEEELVSYFDSKIPGFQYKKGVGVQNGRKKISLWVKGTEHEFRVRFVKKTYKDPSSQKVLFEVKQAIDHYVEKEKIRMML